MNKTLRPANPTSYADATTAVMQIFIRDLSLPMLLGIYPHEKTTPQNVTFNIELAVRELSHEAPSQIEDVVCYEKIVNKIKTLVAARHFDFVETLADQVAQLCLANQRVVSVRVRVEKNDAIDEAAGVGVEIERVQTTAL